MGGRKVGGLEGGKGVVREKERKEGRFRIAFKERIMFGGEGVEWRKKRVKEKRVVTQNQGIVLGCKLLTLKKPSTLLPLRLIWRIFYLYLMHSKSTSCRKIFGDSRIVRRSKFGTSD